MLSLKTYLSQPRLLGIALLKRCSFLFSDAMYLRILYRLHMDKRLPLKQPVTFNEKLQWLKLYNRQPLYTRLVDKYEVKRYIAEVIGEEYIIPTLGIWDRVEDIDFNSLPNQFVLKTTHGGGGTGVVICRDKSTFDTDAAKAKLRESMSYNIYHDLKEWPYKDVTPRIIAEQYIADETGELPDYKFFCFSGRADNVMVCVDRSSEVKYYFFDEEWQLLRLNKRGKSAPADFTLPAPPKINQMFKLAGKLSEEMPFVRVDLYCQGNHIYFGELTFFPASGLDANLLPETDLLLGEMIDLTKTERA